ncbi:ABC transporter permease subunit [Bacteriovorax sp. Seq25_V]|uniref:ABC transporter permease subunit n=1 Tax=Bacteriovorax sp. Seq25_V TaxID=1201288 RepID=UPI000389F4F3|nr:ABC transporter permease subunit [Bacteriovorax sp. Seq25_V]EQC44811.1 ABC transporter, permease protein [Bacteriovorax sp. Seq25_V]
MLNYIIRRFLIMIPTFFGVTILMFGMINLAPGSPIEQKIQQMRFGGMGDAGADIAGGSHKDSAVSEEVIEALKKQYGFDKPLYERYWIWLSNLSRLDFGESFTYEEPVLDVVKGKLPVSIQFGVISFFFSYLICIPLGVLKAIKHGSKFDVTSSFLLSALYSIPGFMLGILLLVYFAGGTFVDWFPIGDLYSDNYDELSFWAQMGDRVWHFFLPLVAYMVGQFTVLTLLMKNSMLEVISQDYIRTAKAKGLSDKMVYMKHCLRNALVPIVTGFGHFLSMFFAGSLFIERIFNLDGLGLLGYQSLLERDYNVIMGLFFIQTVLMFVGNLISDILYVVVDPRIDFE